MYWFFRLGKKRKSNNKSGKKDDKCFQCAATVAFNHEEIQLHLKRNWNIKLFINKYKWKGINYQSKIDDCKTFEKNKLTVVLNKILNIKLNTLKKNVQLLFPKLI